MQTEFDSLLELMRAIPDEAAAIEHFKAIRWQNGAFCPFCKGKRVYHFKDKAVHKCGDCRRRFSIRVGTVFESSKIPLRTWLMAVWYLTSHKKSISSVQMAKDLDVSQKTSWFMLHRLRFAAATKSFNGPLTGFIEADESYIGGKETNKPKSKRAEKAHGGKGKEMVFGLLQRGGDLRAFHVTNRPGAINALLLDNVAQGSNLITDEHPAYKGNKGHYFHYSVNHRREEYVRDGFVHTNSIEGFWSLFKRQIVGTNHWVSPKHLHAYLCEMQFRFNRRSMGEGERLNALIAGSDGRLTYDALIEK